MAKCELCGREIGSTAGPCTQCTILQKQNKITECSNCGSIYLSKTDNILLLCNNCGRLV